MKKNEIIIDDFRHAFAMKAYELPEIGNKFSNKQWKSQFEYAQIHETQKSEKSDFKPECFHYRTQ